MSAISNSVLHRVTEAWRRRASIREAESGGYDSVVMAGKAISILKFHGSRWLSRGKPMAVSWKSPNVKIQTSRPPYEKKKAGDRSIFPCMGAIARQKEKRGMAAYNSGQ